LARTIIPLQRPELSWGLIAFIGYSTNTVAQVRKARRLPIDYCGSDPSIPQPQKRCRPVAGISQLRRACEATATDRGDRRDWFVAGVGSPRCRSNEHRRHLRLDVDRTHSSIDGAVPRGCHGETIDPRVGGIGFQYTSAPARKTRVILKREPLPLGHNRFPPPPRLPFGAQTSGL